MNTFDINYLKNKNFHENDKGTSLNEETHIYNIQGEYDYTSMTTFIHSLFNTFDADKIITNMMNSKNWVNSKYYGMTREEIKDLWNKNKINASENGTNMHLNIEKFYNGANIVDESIEWLYFMKFYQDYKDKLEPYRTEWIVYDKEIKIAGSIDIIFKSKPEKILNDKEVIDIYDWKRCKDIKKVNNFDKWAINLNISHIPDTNYWHYAFQLNGYKWILEKNYDKIIRDMYLVCLHPDNSNKSYKLIKIPDLQNEITLLFQERINNIN